MATRNEGKKKRERELCLLPRVEEIIDEDWREDVKTYGFWCIQSPSMILWCGCE